MDHDSRTEFVQEIEVEQKVGKTTSVRTKKQKALRGINGVKGWENPNNTD